MVTNLDAGCLNIGKQRRTRRAHAFRIDNYVDNQEYGKKKRRLIDDTPNICAWCAIFQDPHSVGSKGKKCI